jgi:hypothetical protein
VYSTRIALAICIACLACSSGPRPPAAPVEAAGSVAAAPIDDEAAPRTISGRVSLLIPEFGGAYIDHDGYLTVYLTDLAREADVRKTLASELLASGRESPAIRVRRGQYAFADLWRWQRAMRALLVLPGVTMLSIDERANRVRMATTGGAPALAAQVQRAGVPMGAVLIDATARAEEAGSLDGSLRPAIAGLRVSGFFQQSAVTYTIICSYGPNVRDFADTLHHYMIVASHCAQNSPPVGGFVGANIYQPDTTNPTANLIGTVVTNPPFVSGGSCPAGALCRASDAALVRIASGVSATLGAVARTVAPTYLPSVYGSTTISTTQPTFTLAGYTESLVGDTVSKVGGATGWTVGVVTGTCADINIGGYIRTCSGVVSAGAGRGDSGAPVIFENARGKYYIEGVLFGFIDNGADGQSGNQYFFSNWTAVSDDLAGFAGLAVR